MVQPTRLSNRLTRLLGVDVPIIQAPMGWIARSRLASAVSNAGGLGVIETSSGELDAIREEISRMRDLTDRPFGVNIAQAFVKDDSIADFVIEQGVRVVTTSAGSPARFTPALKAAGICVLHVVPTLHAALKAAEAGVDALIVEGGEGGGFKNPRAVGSMVLLPLVASKLDLPLVAAGGVSDGRSLAAALALGADGAQMGTRMLSSAESPVHENWKQAVVDASETDTLLLNQHRSPALRALRTQRTESAMFDTSVNAMTLFADHHKLYFGGDLEASIALTGQVAGRIDSVLPVQAILDGCVEECVAILNGLASKHVE